jgi:hypothetical protein
MKINGKFIDYETLGRKIMSKLAFGYQLDVYYDKFGNGYMEFYLSKEHPSYPVEFTEMKVEDYVEIEYNELGELHRVDELPHWCNSQ